MADRQDLLFLLSVSLKKASPVEKWAAVRDSSPPLWLVCRKSKHGIIKCVVGHLKVFCLHCRFCRYRTPESSGTSCSPYRTLARVAPWSLSCRLYPAVCKEATGAQHTPVPEGLAFVCPDGRPRAQPRTPHPGSRPLPSYPPLPARPPRLFKSALLCPTLGWGSLPASPGLGRLCWGSP